MAILITTSDVKEPYEIMDAIFAFDLHKESFWGGAADPAKAFDNVKEKLRTVCQNMGGDAVIHCQFEYRVAQSQELFGKAKQVMEIFAYGTTVRFVTPKKAMTSKATSADKIRCDNCQKEMPIGADFCSECGTQLKK